LTILHAYFDESERMGGLLCVAGYVFSPEQARKFTKEWQRLFGKYGGLHMREFIHLRGRFKEITQQERDRMLCEAVNIINRRITLGVAISCHTHEVDAISAKFVRGYGHAYPLCCHLAMSDAVIGLNEAGYQGNIAYVFEAGHAHEAEARDFVKVAALNDELRSMFRYHSDAFIPKSDAVPLQAADLLAWEWAKCQDETIEQPIRHVRKSLKSLFLHAPKRYKVAHCTGDMLKEYMHNIRELAFPVKPGGSRMPVSGAGGRP
jgi:hypothetical protein